MCYVNNQFSKNVDPVPTTFHVTEDTSHIHCTFCITVCIYIIDGTAYSCARSIHFLRICVVFMHEQRYTLPERCITKKHHHTRVVLMYTTGYARVRSGRDVYCMSSLPGHNQYLGALRNVKLPKFMLYVILYSQDHLGKVSP